MMTTQRETTRRGGRTDEVVVVDVDVVVEVDVVDCLFQQSAGIHSLEKDGPVPIVTY